MRITVIEALTNFRSVMSFIFEVIQNEPILLMSLAGGLLAISALLFVAIRDRD